MFASIDALEMGSGGSVQQIHVTKDDLKKGRIEINRSVSAPNTKKTKKKNDFVVNIVLTYVLLS